MFELQDEQWIEVDNFAEGPSDPYILAPFQGKPRRPHLVGLSPIFSDPSQLVTLRVVIIGHVMHGKEITDELIVDYIDINLEP
jgi:hypothetical protein